MKLMIPIIVIVMLAIAGLFLMMQNKGQASNTNTGGLPNVAGTPGTSGASSTANTGPTSGNNGALANINCEKILPRGFLEGILGISDVSYSETFSKGSSSMSSGVICQTSVGGGTAQFKHIRITVSYWGNNAPEFEKVYGDDGAIKVGTNHFESSSSAVQGGVTISESLLTPTGFYVDVSYTYTQNAESLSIASEMARKIATGVSSNLAIPSTTSLDTNSAAIRCGDILSKEFLESTFKATQRTAAYTTNQTNPSNYLCMYVLSHSEVEVDIVSIGVTSEGHYDVDTAANHGFIQTNKFGLKSAQLIGPNAMEYIILREDNSIVSLSITGTKPLQIGVEELEKVTQEVLAHLS